MSTLKYQAMALIVLGMAVLGLGCGNQKSIEPLSDVNFDNGTLAKCLKSNGARFATKESDLNFFEAAEADEAASMFATYWDRPTKLFVQLWQDGEDPREWILWQAQPFDGDESPSEIVNSLPTESYVAYVRSPSRSQRDSLEACTEINDVLN